MQKTCKSDVCKRKFEKTSLSDLCPPCAAAYKSGESQSQRRAGNSSRQTKARAGNFDTNRDLLDFTFPPPSNTTQPMSTYSGTQPIIATTSMTGPAAQSVVSTTCTQPTPSIDMNRLQNTFQSMSGPTPAPTAAPTPDRQLADMYGMLVHLCKKSEETEEMKINISSNVNRLDRLEARLGNPEDVAVPLSLAIQNIPLPGSGSDDLQIIKALFREINAPGVNIDTDITKVVRQGATDENLGTVMVEMRSDESRASIMKTKGSLAGHNNPGLRKVIIRNMKTRHELKVDIALNQMLKKFPGGENFYIANNGHIREKTPHQRAYQNSFQSRIPALPVSTPANLLPPNQHTGPYKPTSQFSVPPPTHPVTLPTYTMANQSLTFPPPPAWSSGPFMFSGPSQPNTQLPGMSYTTLVPRPGAPFVFTGGAPQPQAVPSTPMTGLSTAPAPVLSAVSQPSSQPDTVAITPVVVSETDSSQEVQPAVSQADQPAVSLPGPGHQAEEVSMTT